MYEQIASNKRLSYLIIFVFILLIVAMGYVFGQLTYFGYTGVALAAIIAIGMSWGSYYYSDQLVLKMSKARPVEKSEFPQVLNIVEAIAIAAGVPTPKMYVIDNPSPNAFATGRDPEHSAIAVTTGLIKKLKRIELEGVIAHEMSHIKNYDIRFMTLTVVMVGVVLLLSDWLMYSFWFGGRRREGGGGQIGAIIAIAGIALVILAPLFAQLIRFAISRKREFLADASGAMLTRYPDGLASALGKISSDKVQLKSANKATASLYIVTPLREGKRKIRSVFDTHPPIEERVKRLKEMAFEEVKE